MVAFLIGSQKSVPHSFAPLSGLRNGITFHLQLTRIPLNRYSDYRDFARCKMDDTTLLLYCIAIGCRSYSCQMCTSLLLLLCYSSPRLGHFVEHFWAVYQSLYDELEVCTMKGGFDRYERCRLSSRPKLRRNEAFRLHFPYKFTHQCWTDTWAGNHR
jgi:hypothetical protein